MKEVIREEDVVEEDLYLKTGPNWSCLGPFVSSRPPCGSDRAVRSW